MERYPYRKLYRHTQTPFRLVTCHPSRRVPLVGSRLVPLVRLLVGWTRRDALWAGSQAALSLVRETIRRVNIPTWGYFPVGEHTHVRMFGTSRTYTRVYVPCRLARVSLGRRETYGAH
jgi:hypothetical protein